MFYQAIHSRKQTFHQMLDRRMQYLEQTAFLEKIIHQIRHDHATMSCRAMYYKILPSHIGRDKFEKLCMEWGYAAPQKINYRRTTNSNGIIRFDDLLTGLQLTHCDQAYCSDITYYEVENKYYYLTFIMDCYSRRILGHSVSDQLTAEKTTLAALKMVIRKKGGSLPPDIIFHSDGGGQYYDKAFRELTRKHHMRNSMCVYPFENGKAERINGTIKNNYLKYYPIKSLEDLIKYVDRSVYLYNEHRPHKALGYLTPVEYEKKCVTLKEQTTPTMTESFDAITKSNGASSPLRLEQTTPQNQDVFSTINQNMRE